MMEKITFAINIICFLGIVSTGTAMIVRRHLKRKNHAVYSDDTIRKAKEFIKKQQDLEAEQLENERLFAEYEEENQE